LTISFGFASSLIIVLPKLQFQEPLHLEEQERKICSR
jgi:hypothetical protein